MIRPLASILSLAYYLIGASQVEAVFSVLLVTMVTLLVSGWLIGYRFDATAWGLVLVPSHPHFSFPMSTMHSDL
jgi:hypothetical protein